MKPPTLIYTRTSCTGTAGDDAHQRQLADLRRVLTEHGHDPDAAEVIRDTGRGALSGLGRVEALLTSGEVTVLAIADPTRLDRGPRNWRVLIEARDRGVRVLTAHGPMSREALRFMCLAVVLRAPRRGS